MAGKRKFKFKFKFYQALGLARLLLPVHAHQQEGRQKGCGAGLSSVFFQQSHVRYDLNVVRKAAGKFRDIFSNAPDINPLIKSGRDCCGQ